MTAVARARRAKGRLRHLGLLAVIALAAAATPMLTGPTPVRAASASSSVGYITTNALFGLWGDALGITAPNDGGTYSTAAPASPVTVTIHDIDMAKLDVPASTALTSVALDTLVMYMTCDIGNHPQAMKAINSFVDNGGKLIVLDGAQCTDTQGGEEDFSTFLKPFRADFVDPDPQQTFPSSPYSFVGEAGSSLTTGMPDCTAAAPTATGCEPGNTTADASIVSPNSPGWCTALAGTQNNGTATNAKGPMMAYTRSPSGKGFVAVDTEAFAWSTGDVATQTHLRTVFDDMLAQKWNGDGLTCARTARSLALTPFSQQPANGVGDTAQLQATVTDGGNPVPGISVTFTVLSGPDGAAPASGGNPARSALTLSGVTGADGVATVSYSTKLIGTDTWVATYSDADDHVSGLATVTWNRGRQVITFTSTAPTNAYVGGPTYAVTATGGASGNPVLLTVDATASSVCSITGATVSFTATGTCVIDANQLASANYFPANQVQQSFAVGKVPQTVTFTSTPPVSPKVGTTYTVTATGGGSGNPVTLSIDSSATATCSISGAVVTFNAIGTCVIDANQAGNATFAAAAQVQQSIDVGKTPQTITFTSSPPAGAAVGGPAYNVSALGGASGNPVVFSIDPTALTICSVAGATVSFTAPGTCVVDANQAGSSTFGAAPQAQQSFAVGRGAQAITFTSSAPTTAAVGGTYAVTATGGGSGNPVTLSVDAAAASFCSISGSTVTFTGVGTCVVDANQAGSAAYTAAPQAQQSFAIARGSQTITFTSTAPANASVGGPTYTVTATGGGSGSPVTFSIDASATAVCAISGATVSFVAAGSCVVDADQAGTATYNAAPRVQQSFAVSSLSQTIVFTSTPPAGAVVGDTYTVSATGGGSGNPVTFTVDASATSVCSISSATVSMTGAGTCVVDANQAGDATHAPASQVQQSFAVVRRPQTITFTSTPPAAVAGGPVYRPSATGGASGNLVTFSVDASASAVCAASSGSTISFNAIGTCVVDADQLGNATYAPAAEVQQSFTVGQGSQTVAFTTSPPVDARVGGPFYAPDATGGLSGNPVVFSVDAGAAAMCEVTAGQIFFTAVGTCVVDADQAGNASYLAAPRVQQSFAVGPPVSTGLTCAAGTPRCAAAAPDADVGDGQYVRVSFGGFDAKTGVQYRECKAAPVNVATDCTPPIPGTSTISDATGAGADFVPVQSGPTITTQSGAASLACDAATGCVLAVMKDAGDLTTAAFAPLAFARSRSDCPPFANDGVIGDGSESAYRALATWEVTVCQPPQGVSADFTRTYSSHALFSFEQKLADFGVFGPLDPASAPLPTSGPAYRVAPLTASALVIAFGMKDSFSGQPITRLVLTPQQIARIFTGTQVPLSLDPSVLALNPGVSFPGVLGAEVRSGSSAQSLVFTSWMAATAPDVWKAGPQAIYPSFTGVNQRATATNEALDARGGGQSIAEFSVMDASTAAFFGLPTVTIAQSDGSQVSATPVGEPEIEPTLAAATVGPGNQLTFDYSKVDPKGYPLVVPTYMMVPTDSTGKLGTGCTDTSDPTACAQERGTMLAALLRYAVQDGQKALPPGYAPLPANLVALSLDVAKAIPQQAAAPAGSSGAGSTGAGSTGSSSGSAPSSGTTAAPSSGAASGSSSGGSLSPVGFAVGLPPGGLRPIPQRTPGPPATPQTGGPAASSDGSKPSVVPSELRIPPLADSTAARVVVPVIAGMGVVGLLVGGTLEALVRRRPELAGTEPRDDGGGGSP